MTRCCRASGNGGLGSLVTLPKRCKFAIFLGLEYHNNPNMSKYIIYARKSSESEERQMLSIDSQLNELKSVAKKQEIQIYRIMTESKSAKSPGRPVFNSMIELIKKGEADSILVWNPDRLSRNSVDAGMLIYLFDIGILQEITTPYQSFRNTPNDKFLLNILWGQAKLDNDNKGVNVKRGMKTKAGMGWYPYPALNGYLNTPERQKGFKIIVKDPDRFHLVRKMWDLMLTGIYTIPQVLEIVNGKWGYKDRRDKPISRSCMYEMFSHPFYYGYYQYDDVWYKGKHEPMVTKDEWDKVQKLIHRNNVSHTYANEFLYIDLLKCGYCGFSITGTRKHKFYKRTGRKADYTYYHCTHKNKFVACHEQPVTEKKLEDQLIKVLESVEIDDDFKNWAKQYYHELSDFESKNVFDINSNVQKQIINIDKKLDSLLDLKLTDSITKDEYDKKRKDLMIEKSTLKDNLDKNSDWLLKANKAIDTAHDIKSKFLNKSKDGKRLLIRSIGSNLFLEKGLVRPELEKPYFIFSDAKNNPKKYFRRIEPVDYPYLSRQTINLAKKNPTWLRGLDEVRTCLMSKDLGYIPLLS